MPNRARQETARIVLQLDTAAASLSIWPVAGSVGRLVRTDIATKIYVV